MGSEQSVPGALPQQPLDLPSITRSAACPYFSRTTSVTEGSGVLTGDLLLSNFVDILAQRNGALTAGASLAWFVVRLELVQHLAQLVEGVAAQLVIHPPSIPSVGN